jgi:predicted acetyltransferase
MSVEIDRAHTAFAPHTQPVGELRLLDGDEAAEVLPALFDEHRLAQPGQVMRTRAFWPAWLRDPECRRWGAGRRFAVAYESASVLSGYATYRFWEGLGSDRPSRALIVEDLVGTNADARAGLWSHCLNADLIDLVRAANVPVDEPLPWMLADPRRLRVTALFDFLWIRILDVPRALSARGYAAPGRLVLEVTDDTCPANSGRFELDVDAAGAACRRTRKTPDLALGASELGATYLGGVSFAVLARARRVEEHTPGGLARADALFNSRPAPWCVTDW